MEKYLVDAPLLRQSRAPSDYTGDTVADGDDDEDMGGRGTPAMHVHDLAASLRSGTLPDVKPLRGVNSDGKLMQAFDIMRITILLLLCYYCCL